MSKDNDSWIRLHTGWSPREVGWALWQPGYVAHPWPRDELGPDFVFYICDDVGKDGRAVVAKAKVTRLVPTTEVESPEDAYRRIADALFDDELTILPENWRANRYNGHKSAAPWPQLLTAWRADLEEVGPHMMPELSSFPRSGWLRTSRLTL